MEKRYKTEFFKNSLAYSSASAAAQFIRLFKEFITRRILSPEIMGFWNFSIVVQSFVGIFDFGCIAGATRELPIMRGRRDQEEETKIRSTTLWFTVFQNIIVGIFAAFFIFWNRANYVQWEIIAAYVGIVIFFLMSFQLVYSTIFTAAQAFVLLSKLLLLSSIIDALTFPLCAYLWGLRGLMAMGVISAFAKNGLFFLYGRKINLSVRPMISWGVVKRLLSFGFFLRLIDYPYALFGMASILWVTKFMNIESLSFFSMARGFFLQVSMITTRIGTVYTMRFLEQTGMGISRHIMADQLKKFLLFQLLVIVPVLSWAAGVVLPFIVRHFIPKYAAANQAFLILLMCSFFYVLNSGLTNHWVAQKRLVARGIANMVGLIAMVAALTVMWFISENRTINGIACATLIGYALYFVYMVIAVGKDFWQLRELAQIIISVTIAAAWVFFILSAGYRSVEHYILITESLKATIIMGAWTLLGILPVLLYGLKSSRALSNFLR